MAAVTVNRRTTNVSGAKKHKTFNIDGDNTNTLATRLRRIDFVGFGTTTITGVTLSGGTITFAASGAFTGIDILAIGI